jgi:hypothetical protein
MLDVALHELMARRAQEMLARQVRAGQQQREDILQLIAESIGAAGLVVTGPRP